MLDKRNLEQILSDQQEELEIRRGETLCHRPEEAQIDLGSTQAQEGTEKVPSWVMLV